MTSVRYKQKTKAFSLALLKVKARYMRNSRYLRYRKKLPISKQNGSTLMDYKNYSNSSDPSQLLLDVIYHLSFSFSFFILYLAMESKIPSTLSNLSIASRASLIPRVFRDIQYYAIDLNQVRRVLPCCRQQRDNHRTIGYYFKRTVLRLIRFLKRTWPSCELRGVTVSLIYLLYFHFKL
jgi:hypothetical protein